MEQVGLMESCFKNEEYFWGDEIGEEKGTPHLQGFLILRKKARPSSFKLGFRWSKFHWEPMEGTIEDNEVYCSKEQRRIWTNMVFPTPLVKIEYKDLLKGQRVVVDKYKEEEDPRFGREIHVYVDEKGGWGKTITTKYFIDQMNAIVVAGKTGDAAYAIAQRIEQHKPIPIVVFDVPRGGRCNWHAVEKIKDGCLFATKYESGMLRFNSPHVVVFTNEWPDLSRLSADRWVVHDLQSHADYSHVDQPDDQIKLLTDVLCL